MNGDAPASRRLLRLVTCGSVDDGKSTLIGRLLFDSGSVPDDAVAAMRADSHRYGTQGDAPDLALLVDGLQAEREQGVTIDVAHRYFSTARRAFVVADAPGHEQYTRNLATAASNADLAVILVDAGKGVLVQTRRHAAIASLLGVRAVVLAVNKMDRIGWAKERFDAVVEEFEGFAKGLAFGEVLAIPLSGLTGGNVVTTAAEAPWYAGPTLLQHLETVDVTDPAEAAAFRLPVQLVVRPNADFRGYAGMVASGRVAPNDRVRVLPSGRETRVARIVTAEGDLVEASAGRSVTLTLQDEIDVSRGDVIAAAADLPEVADRFEAWLIWMDEAPLTLGRDYLMKLGAGTTPARVVALHGQLDVTTLEETPAARLGLNDIGRATLQLDRAIAFEPYARNRTLGGFILIDRATSATAAAGLLTDASRKAHNIHWQASQMDGAARAAMKGQEPRVVWFTGLSGAGKSTIADLVERRLAAEGRHTFLIDGDNLRHGLNRDLGFSEADRAENVRRAAEVARLMVDAGLIVLVSLISPYRAERDAARARFAPGRFLEVHVDAALEVAEARDPKGLYAKARTGQLAGFTGIDSPYEPPFTPDLRLDTAALTAQAAAERVLAALQASWAGDGA